VREINRLQCSQWTRSPPDVRSQYICRYIAPSRSSKYQTRFTAEGSSWGMASMCTTMLCLHDSLTTWSTVDGCFQGALQCGDRNRIFWAILVEHVEMFLEHVVHVTVIGQEASGRVFIPIHDCLLTISKGTGGAGDGTRAGCRPP
jgi:hypothetical protein